MLKCSRRTLAGLTQR